MRAPPPLQWQCSGAGSLQRRVWLDYTIEQVDAIIDEVIGPSLESYLTSPDPCYHPDPHG